MRMKLVFAILLICICSSLGACNNAGKQKNASVIGDAYVVYNEFIRDFFSELKKDFNTGGLRYSLALIDDDDIPELIISYGDYHAAGVKICFYDPEIKRVLETNGEKALYGENGGFEYYVRKSCIYDYYFTGGTAYISFCRIERSGDEYTVKKGADLRQSFSDDMHYYVDSAEVTQEDYEAAYDKEAAELADLKPVSVEYGDMSGTYETAYGDDWLSVFQTMYEAIRD